MNPRFKLSKQCSARLVLTSVLCLLGMTTWLAGAPPDWWSNQNVIDTGKSADDFAVANQGQAKNLAKKAYLEMEAKLPGGAGTELDALIVSWSQPNALRNDYAVINLGQLKALSKPFYDRLISAGQLSGYPWTDAVNAPDDYAAANIGQLKNLFSFEIVDDVENDEDGDGISDSWEQGVADSDPNDLIFSPNDIRPGDDLDSDGLSNLEEYEQGSDPLNYYSQGSEVITPVLEVVNGADKVALKGNFAEALVIRVRNGVAGPVLDNAPVTFTTSSGSHLTSNVASGLTAAVQTRTGIDGQTAIYFKAADAGNYGVTATSGSILPATFALEIVEPGPVAVWNMDENGGSTLLDSGGHGFDGGLVNNPSRVSGAVGEGAVNFQSANQNYAWIGAATDPHFAFGNDSFVLAAWVKYTGNEFGRIVTKGYNGWNEGYFLGLDCRADGTFSLSAGIGSGEGEMGVERQGNCLLLISKNDHNDGNWHQVVAVFDHVTQEARLFVDGVAQPVETFAGSGGSIKADGKTVDISSLIHLETKRDLPLTIAARSDGLTPSGFFNGAVDNVIIYRGMLTEENIFDLYQESSLAIASGANQYGLLNDFMPQPIVVRIGRGFGIPNIPIIFSVENGGALLSSTNVDSNNLSSQITVVSDYNGNATAYVFSPNTSNSKSSISASAPLGTSVTTEATTINPELEPPSNLQATPASSTSIDLTWESAGSYDTAILISMDDGVTWTQLAVVNSGITTYTVNGLHPDVSVKFKAASSSSGGGSLNGNSRPSNPTEPIAPLEGVMHFDGRWR